MENKTRVEEYCKRFKYDHTTKWYMHKPESVVENETHKIICDFEIQTDRLISGQKTKPSDY